MTDDEFMGVADIKSDVEPNKPVNLHVTCVELMSPGSEKISQMGRLQDGNSDEITFIAYEQSGHPDLDEGEPYVIHDAQTINDRDEDRAILFRDHTNISHADDLDDIADPTGPDCLFCGDTMPQDAYTEGPDAPEVGWEYYECPHCENKMRADAVR